MSDKEFKHLIDILNDDELKQLSGYVKIKLESHLEGKQSAIDNMKTQLANSAANAEKKSFAVDRDLQNTKSKLQMSEDFAEKLKNQLREAEEALQKSRHDYYEILEGKDSLTYELNSLKERMKRYTDEKMDLTELLDRRQEEIQSLQNEMKTICSKLKTNSEGRLETSVRAEELELKMISVEHQEMRMSQERQLYQKQIQALNDELNAKVNELLALRRDRTIQIFELQSTLETKTDENTKYLEEIKHLKQVVDKKDKHIEILAQRMSELQHFSQQLEEDFQNEIRAQNNLIDLHKQSISDLKKQNETLIQTIEEMQQLLQTAKQAHNDLESAFNESQSKFSDQLNESMEQTSLLTKELEDLKETVANTSRDNLESEFERQYPLAANTKKLLGKNMSFTQIFNELVAKQQELDDQKSENIVLREHLQHLTTEAEENAPLLHRKIHEHQRALHNINELQNQISSLMTERELWLQEKDTIIRIGKQYEREINRFEMENRDLAKQIRGLIKSVQEARGFRVSDAQDSQISSTDGVPQDMVTFKDIEELQVRNQELMSALRETNEKLRRLENEKNDQQMNSLRKDLDEAINQLENLRTERRQQTEMVEALVKQRDLYKMLSSHTNQDTNQIPKTPIGYSSSAFTSVNAISAEEQNKLKSNLEQIKSDFAKHREESDNKIKLLSETNEKLREELSNIKIESAKISSELAFTQERLSMYKTNCEQFQRENALLRERNTILNENSKKHEQSLVLMRQEVLSVNEKVNRQEMTIDSLKSERDLYRNNELKLLQEKELMIRNQDNQNKLINTLQSVQNNLNQMESDSIRNLKTQNSKLEKEVSYLRIKLEKDSERHSEASLLWDKHSQDLQNRLDLEIEKYLKVHKELTEYQTKAKNLENELNTIKTGVNQLNDYQNPASEADRALQSQLIVIREQYSEAQNEVKLLREKLSNAQKASESLRSINSSLEEKLNEHRMTIEEIRERADSIINEKENTINSINKELNEFKARYQRLSEEKNALENDQKNTSQQYLQRINQLTNQLVDSNSRAEKAVLNEKRALEDKNSQMSIASEAQANYERELLQHSRDAQIINSLRNQLESFQNKVFEAESAANRAQEQLSQSHQMWENERKSIAENVSKLKEKCNDLERINDTLNQQLELLNNRIIALQNNSTLPLLSKEEEVENTNRLLEVIKFLRKEKEVLQTQITALESEDSRNKLIIENVKKELTHVQNELREERLNAQNIMSNVSQHNEMVKKIEMINILSDSNALLRNEKSNLETKCKELENRLNQIDSQKLSKDIEELNLKIETKNAENVALREELKHWQKRTNGLMEQLNKTSPEDMKRINEEKAKLQQQILSSTQELNKLSQELKSTENARKVLENQMQSIKNNFELKSNEAKKLSEELNALKNESTTNQNTIIQLRKVARKYKLQYDELKVQFDKLNESKSGAVAIGATTSESIPAEVQQKVEELNAKIKEMDQQIEKSNNDLTQVTDEREAARALALEKEERAKKIAHQAKQRLAALSNEKLSILRHKESLEKAIEELKTKIKEMEQTSEESGLRMATMKSQYEAKAIRTEKELSEALKQIENLKTRQQQKTTQPPIQSTSTTIGVSTAAVQTSLTSTSNPVRHSVHPQPATVQPLSAKSTPTASIKPLAVAPTLHRTGRTATATRTATVATVQPTTEESTSHQSVPQATVQPTQTMSSQMAFIPPTSSSESEVIVSQSMSEVEQMDDQNQITSEIPDLLPRIDDSNSQSSLSEEGPPTLVDTRPESSEATTSVKIDRNREKIALKRTRMSSDEMSAPVSPSGKKQRTETEGVRPIEMSHTLSQRADTSSVPQTAPPVEDDDDDCVIILSESDESDVEQRDDSNERENNEEEEEEEEDEEEEEEEEYDEEDDEENVANDSQREIYGDDNEQYDEEEEEDDESHYEEEQNEDNDEGNDAEEIEVVGVSDDVPDMNPIEESDERQQRSEASTSESNDPNVSTTMSALPMTSVVTSSTESNPFVQIPTPIQRTGFQRQSFYLNQPQQSAYDEGDGIVPSTPTLIVPRRGDSYTDALNSPRVPQSRFVFNASIPETPPLSQLATETTLGVDDTRMDLSQFDDNNGRSVPTTPLATSPANNRVHSTVQNLDVDNDSNQNFGIDPNVSETIVPTDFESDSSHVDTETINTSTDNQLSDQSIGQMAEQMSETQTQVSNSDDTSKDEEEIQIQNESIPTSSTVIRHTQMARRGRAFGSAQRAALQRRPILPPTTSQPMGGMPPNQPPTPLNPQNQNPQIQSSQPAGRTIRLPRNQWARGMGAARGSNFRGRPSRGGPRGGYHYNN